jgi:hypothetical protein
MLKSPQQHLRREHYPAVHRRVKERLPMAQETLPMRSASSQQCPAAGPDTAPAAQSSSF